jgi:acetoin:2,6-dichlorophenolindophenol oxidoreductase subunit beta
MPVKTIRQALQEALAHEMRRDPRVVVIGEDVSGGAAPKAGAMPRAACLASPRG